MKIEGKLFLWSETGMEGGYLSIQDRSYITYSLSRYGITNNCKVWDRNNLSRYGITSDSEFLIENKWSRIPKQGFQIPEGTKTRVTVNWFDGSIQEKVLSDDLLIEQWDYQGSHFLKNEDSIKIIDPAASDIICEGQINQIPLNVFSKTSKGHFEQLEGNSACDWVTFFAKNYLAQVTRR